jgi:4-aminobutyrate aminotransferase/(S)-3-amino-2-methylpropionate transaminase
MPTPKYFRHLRDLASEFGIPFIIDETRTGLGKTGKFWAYEHWFLDNSPDFVTFGRAAVASGYFSTANFRPSEAHKLTTICNGSMEKLVALKHIVDYIKRKDLLERTDDTGAFIKAELDRVNQKSDIYTNLRGNGTFLGFDLKDSNSVNHFQTHLIRNGILASMVGHRTIGIRPSLMLEPNHASHFRDVFQSYNPSFHFDVVMN